LTTASATARNSFSVFGISCAVTVDEASIKKKEEKREKREERRRNIPGLQWEVIFLKKKVID
jgi:hypothetical protein